MLIDRLMLRSRFLWQVWAILGLTLVVSTLVFSFLVADLAQRDAFARVERSMLNQARTLSPVMADLLVDDAGLSPADLRQLTPGTTYRITLIGEDGRVLADNREAPALMDNHGQRPEVLDALEASHGTSQRFSETLGQQMLYLAVQLRSPAKSAPSGQVREGFLRLALPVTFIEDEISALRRRIAAAAAAIGLAFLVISYLLAWRVASPISSMTERARKIAKGQYHLRFSLGRRDEIGQLAEVINELALGAQARIDQLLDSRNDLEAVLAGLTEGVVAFDHEQCIIHVNDAALEMLRLDRGKVMGGSLDIVQTAPEIKRAVATCFDEGVDAMSTASFGGRSLEYSTRLMHNSIDAGAGVLLVIEDVTERRHLEQVRTDFVANASHELKTPISAIRGLVETIIDDPSMSPEVFASFIGRIRQQTINLDNIVRDLLQLSRFDTETREKSLTYIDLAGLLRQVHQARLEDAEAAGIELELDIQADNLETEGEAEALHQLVINLVDNAIKYTLAGGRVQMRLLQSGDLAQLEVEDTGVGISKSEIERIFERFYRVDRARTHDSGGTGLGLSIVKHIAQAHQGTVKVSSQLGKGSVFTVQLPLADMGLTA